MTSLLLTVALALPACKPGVSAAPPAPPVPVASATASPQVQEAFDLASRGELSALAEKIICAEPGTFSPELTAAAQDWQTHLAERMDVRSEARNKAEELREKRLSAGDLLAALSHTAVAIQNAPDAAAYRQSESVTALRTQAEQAAQEAEAEGDWLAATRIYRRLSEWQDPQQPYYDDLHRLSTREALLATYDPDTLIQYYEEDRKRQLALRKAAEEAEADANAEAAEASEANADAEAAPKDADTTEENQDADTAEAEDPPLDTTPWQETLEGINRNIVEQALYRAMLAHVTGKPLNEVVLQGVRRLQLLMDAAPLSDVIPEGTDPAALIAVRAHLDAVEEDLARDGRVLSFNAARRVLEGLIEVCAHHLSLPEEVVLHEFAEGSMDALDPFTGIIWPSQMQEFNRLMKGDFSGIGVQIGLRDNRVTVITPLVGTPAMAAGMLAGDVITEVEGQSTSGWPLDRAVRHITGKAGTDVNLTIERPGTEEPIKMVITRARIELRPVRGFSRRQAHEGDTVEPWDYWLDEQQGLGFIRLDQFLPQAVEDCDSAFRQLSKEGELRGLVLDLRDNPGGLLTAAVDLVDRFIPQGRIVGSVDGRGRVSQAFDAHTRDTWGDFPVVVLINDGSASASEIVSGALKDHKRAVIVGQNSFGKGSVQNVLPVAGDALMRLTVEHYTLPSGRIIHRHPGDTSWGVAPDANVSISGHERVAVREAWARADFALADQKLEEDELTAQAILARGIDPQLEAARLILLALCEGQHATAPLAEAP